jgi:transposase
MSDRPPPRLRQPDRTQVIPAIVLEDLIEPDHPVRVVWDFCLGLDLTPLYDAIRSREGGPGRAALDPRVCVALWLYATLEGVGSARALARLCTCHHAFRWLCGGVSVNHHTLSDFRVDHLEVLDRLLTHSVALLRQQDLVDLNRVAHDGMRVRASAGAASFHRRPTLERCLHEAQTQVERLKQELQAADAGAPSRRQAAARERAARERAERLQQALERLPELEAKKKPAEKEQARCSSSDPEATVMKMADGGFRPAYNVEFSVAGASLVIAAVEVTTCGSDAGQITPLDDQLESRHGQYPHEVLVDGGFVNLDDIEAAQAAPRGSLVYAPVPEPKDPQRERYAPRPGDSELVQEWRRRMGTEAAQTLYRQRASTVECTNAQVRNRGMLRLLVRGLSKVKAVVLWFALAQNLACAMRLQARFGAAA